MATKSSFKYLYYHIPSNAALHSEISPRHTNRVASVSHAGGAMSRSFRRVRPDMLRDRSSTSEIIHNLAKEVLRGYQQDPIYLAVAPKVSDCVTRVPRRI